MADEKKLTGMSTVTSLFLSLSFTHTHMRFTSMQKCGLFTCQKHHQTMSYSAPLWVQWEVPGPTSPHTISPKACPTPTIVPHSTHTHTHNGHSRARGPTMQFHHTKTHTSPYPVRERKKNDRGGRRKIVTLGEGGMEENKWNTKCKVSVAGV